MALFFERVIDTLVPHRTLINDLCKEKVRGVKLCSLDRSILPRSQRHDLFIAPFVFHQSLKQKMSSAVQTGGGIIHLLDELAENLLAGPTRSVSP